MKCSTHSDVDAVGVCVNCGRAVCSTCCTVVDVKTYCPACASRVSNVVKGQPAAKLTVGGILGIIAGVVGLIIGFILIAGGSATDYYWESIDWTAVGLGIAEIVFSLLAIAGSGFVFARKNFTFSVIGGICATLALWPLGIPALILIAMSRNEFQTASASPVCAKCGQVNPAGAGFCMKCGRELPGR